MSPQERECTEDLSRFDRLLGTVASDLARVHEQHEAIEEQIASRTKDEHNQRDVLMEEKAQLENDVEVLQKQLENKLKALQNVSTRLTEAQSAIERARHSYNKQLHRLDERTKAVMKEKEELEVER